MGQPGCRVGHHGLLIRRHPRPDEFAFDRCYSPTPVRLGELITVAGRRWSIEECFPAGKGLAGLEDHQIRRWLAWRRWTLLAMLAHALLAVIATTERTQHPPQPELIALTYHEIRRLFTKLIIEPTRRLTNPLACSRWRRHHQHHARAYHYRRQQAQLR
jgi:SRSO17 transposase